ncbi:MAG: hypothetical protein QW156_04255 [Candidatus Aenigmatarchaeota archaeon]
MRFPEFFGKHKIKKGVEEEKGDRTKEIKTGCDPEISLITLEELNERLYLPLKEIEIVEDVPDERNREILEDITTVYAGFPDSVKRLFRYKTSAIYYLPYKCNLSGLTIVDRYHNDKAIIVVNAKAAERGISITLLHELGHCLDFNTYPPMYTPKWAWKFLDKFDKEIVIKEPEPLEGIERDDAYFFGERKEEWASRLAATILALYFPKASEITVTGLRKPPLTVDEFKEEYPQSYRFFKNFLRMLSKQMID